MPGLLYPAYQKLYNALNSLDRFKKESNFFDNISAFLVCASVDKKLNEKEYVFDKKSLKHMEYIAYVMKNGLNNQLIISATNLFPIIQAFKKRLSTD